MAARSSGSTRASTSGARRSSPAAIEFHGDDASLALGSFQEFDATVEFGAYGEDLRAGGARSDPGIAGTAWARGVAEMAAAIAEDRPHRASGEQAAHVVEILEAAATSMADGGRRIDITTSFSSPPLMRWAEGALSAGPTADAQPGTAGP